MRFFRVGSEPSSLGWGFTFSGWIRLGCKFKRSNLRFNKKAPNSQSIITCFQAMDDLAWRLRSVMSQDELPTPSSIDPAQSLGTSDGATDESDISYDKILVPIDFSEHSKRTVSYAIKTASKHKATIYLLHVFQIPDYVVTPYARRRQNCVDAHLQVDIAEREARETLHEFAEELSKKGIKVQSYLRVGYPFDEIVLMANHFNVDLIIIGSHGRGAISRLLLGSTAERVVEHALCPVLVVKGPRPGAKSE
jgi:nucleotide-binding universal stress UspA family protein